MSFLAWDGLRTVGGAPEDPGLLPGYEAVPVHTQLQQTQEDGGDVEVRFPHGEAAPDEINGRPADRGEGRQTHRRRLEQQVRQRFTCRQGDTSKSFHIGFMSYIDDIPSV